MSDENHNFDDANLEGVVEPILLKPDLLHDALQEAGLALLCELEDLQLLEIKNNYQINSLSVCSDDCETVHTTLSVLHAWGKAGEYNDLYRYFQLEHNAHISIEATVSCAMDLDELFDEIEENAGIRLIDPEVELHIVLRAMHDGEVSLPKCDDVPPIVRKIWATQE